MCLLLKGEPGKENGREMDIEMANGKWKWKWKILYFLNRSGSCVFSCLSYSFFYCDLKFQDFRPSQSHCMWSVRIGAPSLLAPGSFPSTTALFPGGSALTYLTCRYGMQCTPACVCRPKTRLASKSRHPIVGRRVSDLEVSDAGSCCLVDTWSSCVAVAAQCSRIQYFSCHGSVKSQAATAVVSCWRYT